MWIGGSSAAAIRRPAKYGAGWQAGGESVAEIAPVIAAIRDAAIAAGRPIDEDHYGAAFPFRFGRADDPGMARAMETYRTRTGRDPTTMFAVGDAATIVERITEFVQAGASKFILRPAGGGGAGLDGQTGGLI